VKSLETQPLETIQSAITAPKQTLKEYEAASRNSTLILRLEFVLERMMRAIRNPDNTHRARI
jgi:hypothetical protein